MADVPLTHGTVHVRDTGTGEPVVFLHGLLVNGLLWRKVVDRLEGRFRCIVPDLPLGSHATAMRQDADLSPPGLARLVVELLDALGLERATLVGNDTGGAIAQLVAAHHPERVTKLVLTNCDAFETFPPRLFAYLKLAARIPGATALLAHTMRVRPLRRLPIAYGRLTHEPVDDDVMDAWLEPVRRDSGVRRDLANTIKQIDKRYTLEAADRLRTFQRPVLLAWGADDTLFPLSLAERLAATLPDAHLERIVGAWTFVPEEAPDDVADAIARFVTAPA